MRADIAITCLSTSILSWDEQYKKLKVYRSKQETLKVSADYDKELHTWTVKQKNIVQHFVGKPVQLPNERVKKLINLG